MNKKTVGIIVIVVPGLLIFFSGTVYFYRLPEVSAVRPFRGTLNKLEIAAGLASWAEQETMYAVRSGTAGAVLVREGEEVHKGQVLLTMNFDVEGTERNLRELQNNITKLQNDISFTTGKLETMAGALDRDLSETPSGVPEGTGEEGYRNSMPVDNSMSADGSARVDSSASLELDRAARELWAAELAYSMGIKSGYDLQSVRDGMRALRLKYEEEQKTLRFELEEKRLDLQNRRIQEEILLSTLDDFRTHALVRAPAGGFIVSLAVGKGMYIQENAPLLSIGLGNEFTVECTVAPENNFILPGDHCELSNSSHVLDGTVLTVKTGGRGKIAAVRVVSNEVRAGESFEVTFEKRSSTSYTLVPNAAVNRDNNGYFLNQIKRRKGIMGEEYYAARLDVYIGDSDLNNTVIVWGLGFFEPVILRSDKPVSAGDSVFLNNPEDFFEN